MYVYILPYIHTQVHIHICKCRDIHAEHWQGTETSRGCEEMRREITSFFINTVHFSCSVMSKSLWPHGLQHASLPCPLPAPEAYLNSCPLSWWFHPAISSSVIPFPSCPQSLPVSGSFPMSQLFTWGGQSIGVSASALVLPMNIQDWFPLGWTGWISLQSKGLTRVFSNTTVGKHQFFNSQLSTPKHDYWKNHSFDYMEICHQSKVLNF